MRDAILFLPELSLLLSALAVLFCPIIGLPWKRTRGIAVAGALLSAALAGATIGERGEPFSAEMYRVDFFSQLLKLAIGGLTAAAVLMMSDPKTARPTLRPELALMILLSACGMMMMTSATELLTLFVAMELAAFPLYVMATLHRGTHLASEGAVKYMLQGIAASAVTAYGMSFIYGVSRSTQLAELTLRGAELMAIPLFQFGLVLALAGFLFKLGAFPLHFWAPDTYQSAPHEVVAFIATASKVAAAGLLCRLLVPAVDCSIDAEGLRVFLAWSGAVAMTVGNLGALAQRDLKRLLGYSAVAHAGYMLVGLQAVSALGFASVLFYALAYGVIGLLCFAAVIEVARESDHPGIESLAGLHHRSPLLALALLVGVFGLTGLPPTAGFIGKWFLFSAAIERGQFALVLVAAINSVISLGYYLRLVRAAYYDPPVTTARIRLKPFAASVVAAMIVLAVWMGTAPGTAWKASQVAAGALLGKPTEVARR